MANRKPLRTRGKISFSRYFQRLNTGDNVSIVREKSIEFNFPERFQGRTGVIEGKKGRLCMVKINDQDKVKHLLIKPIHLKKIKNP